MPMDDETKRALTDALLSLDSEQLDRLHDGLVRTRTDLEDLNSVFPATREFLAKRGLRNVRELDEEGLAELKAHLTSLKDALERRFN